MQCREFEVRLNLLLDQRLPLHADTLLAAHAERCPACSGLLAGHAAVLAGVRQWREQPALRPAADFSRRVVAQVQVAAAERPSRRSWLVAAGLVATAAAVMLAISIAAWNSPAAPDVVANSNVPQLDSTPRTLQGGKGSLAAHEAAPSGRAPRFRSGALSLFARPAGGYREAIADVASTLPEAVERLDDAPGIRPIRISFTMLLEALWRAIPGMSSDESNQPSALLRPAGSGLV